MIDTSHLEQQLETLILKTHGHYQDPAHDILHLKRVANMAKKLSIQEGGDLAIIIPAAWLHDFVIVSKDSKERHLASTYSAQAAAQYLSQIKYPYDLIDPIKHAIMAHSFSAQIKPKTKEAQIVQDADRLDAIGAIGIARCFSTTGLLKRPFYEPTDPFCEQRCVNDKIYAIDHFYQKLLTIQSSLCTQAAQKEAQQRQQIMHTYLNALKQEIQDELA